MGFGTWIAEVQGIVTFVVEPDEWRRYYDAGLSPLDAVAQHIKDEEVRPRLQPAAAFIGSVLLHCQSLCRCLPRAIQFCRCGLICPPRREQGGNS